MRLSVILGCLTIFIGSSIQAATYVVTPDGTGDFPTIQEAIAGVADGDSVLLADGIFTGAGNRRIQGFGKAIVVKSQSGDPETCILDCEDVDRAFDFHGGEGRDFVLDGIRIINGVANGGGAIGCSPSSMPAILNCSFESNHSSNNGGAIFFEGSSPLVQACTFMNNTAYFRGGAIGCGTASPDIIDCIFIQNSADIGGGIHCSTDSSPTISGCIFKYNEAPYSTGGGISCHYSSTPQIIDCYFLGNITDYCGGAIYSSQTSNPTVTGCVFEANIADDWGGGFECNGAGRISDCTFIENIALGAGGGMAFAWGLLSPFIQNCTFEGNSAPRGGGLATYIQNPGIEGCTFYGNAASIEAGGLFLEGASTVLMERTIVSYCSHGEVIVVENEGDVVLTCCDLYGNVGGDWIGVIEDQYGINGNICLNPLFCNAGNSDFTLQAISPCAPFSNPNPECDLIGAWPVACGYGSVPKIMPDGDLFLSHAVPNPLRASTRFQFNTATGSADVKLQIHDATGRLVRAWSRDAGMQTVTWDGCDGVGRRVPAGIYYLRLNVGNESARRTITVIR